MSSVKYCHCTSNLGVWDKSHPLHWSTHYLGHTIPFQVIVNHGGQWIVPSDENSFMFFNLSWWKLDEIAKSELWWIHRVKWQTHKPATAYVSQCMTIIWLHKLRIHTYSKMKQNRTSSQKRKKWRIESRGQNRRTRISFVGHNRAGPTFSSVTKMKWCYEGQDACTSRKPLRSLDCRVADREEPQQEEVT